MNVLMPTCCACMPSSIRERTDIVTTVNVRRPSPLQRRVLIVLAALDAKRPGPVATRDIERLLAQGGDAPLLAAEQAFVLAERRATEVKVMPIVPVRLADETVDRPVELGSSWHMACRGDYIIRLDGTTCLQLWNTAGLAGDPLQVATWPQNANY